MSAAPSPRQLSCSVLVLRCLQPQLSGDDQAEAFRDEALAALGRARPENVVLDLSAVRYLSSAGITPLLALVKAVREAEGRLILAGLTPDVEGVLVATRLISEGRSMPATFEHQPTVAAAVAVLS